MIDQFIQHALARNATDMQFIPSKDGFRVFERIDGARRFTTEVRNKSDEDSIIAQVKDRGVMDLAETDKVQFGEFRYQSGTATTYVCAKVFIDDDRRQGITLSFLKQPFMPTMETVVDEPTKHEKAKSETHFVSRGSLEVGI